MSETVRVVTEQECRQGISNAQRRLELLGTSEAELDTRGPDCHHEAEPYDELRKWRFLLDGDAR